MLGNLILELGFIGLPAVFFLVLAVPLEVKAIVPIQMLVLTHMRLSFQLSGLILGIEIFKMINFIKRKNSIKEI